LHAMTDEKKLPPVRIRGALCCQHLKFEKGQFS